jgi:hypothetical protein
MFCPPRIAWQVSQGANRCLARHAPGRGDCLRELGVCVFKAPTPLATGQSRGRRWQRGQKNDERFMNGTRAIGVPQRSQGSPTRP